MIRIRGVPISDEEARELAQLLAGDEASTALVDRIGRALEDADGGLIATSRLEARATLFAVQRMLSRREHSERLLELRSGLVTMLREAERTRPPAPT